MRGLRDLALDIVEDLNNEVSERNGLDYYSPFEFKSIGWQGSVVYFMGVHLWSDDNDERDYIEDTEEKEPLKCFLIRQAEKILKDLNLKMGAF
jgi:hypothetical protein